MRTAIIFRFFFLLCQKRDVRGVRKEDKVMVMEKIDILRLLQFSCLIDNYLCTFLWIRNIFVTTHSIHLSFFHQHLSKKCVQQNVTRKTKWYLLQFHESEEQVDNLTVHGEERLKKGKIWQQLSIKVTRTIPSLWAMTDTDDMCGTSRIWKMELKLMAWKVSLYSKCYKIWYLFLAQNVRKYYWSKIYERQTHSILGYLTKVLFISFIGSL